MSSMLKNDSIVVSTKASAHWSAAASYDVSLVVSTLSLYWYTKLSGFRQSSPRLCRLYPGSDVLMLPCSRGVDPTYVTYYSVVVVDPFGGAWLRNISHS